MKVEITRKNAAGHKVGDIVDVKGEAIPAALVNKCREVAEKKARAKSEAIVTGQSEN